MCSLKQRTHTLAICSIAFVVLVSICASLFMMPLRNVAAASDENTVWRKTLANAIPQCYSSTYMKDSIDGPSYYNTDSVFKKKGSFVNPNGNKMDCRQVFKEANKFFGKNPTLTDLGYTMTTSADSSEARKCLWLEYYMSTNGIDDDKPRKTNQICFHIEDGTIMENPEVQSGGDSGDLALTWSGNGWINIYNSQNPSLELTANYYGQSWEKLISNLESAAGSLSDDYGASVEQNSSSTDVYQKYIINKGHYAAASKKALSYYTGKDSVADFKFNNDDLRYFWDQAYAKMKTDGAVIESGTCFGTAEAAKSHDSSRYPYVHFNPSAPADAQWCPVRVSDNSRSYPVVASNLTSLTMSNPETILGLMTKDAWHNTADQCIAAAIARRDELSAALQNTPNDAENIAQRNYLSQSLLKIRSMLANDGIGTYDKSGSGANAVVTCKALPTVDGGTDVFEPDNGSGQNPGTTPPSDENDQPGMFDGCMNNSGALGWILCPVIRIVSTTVGGIYSDIEENYLIVKSETVTHDATRSTWNIFQNLANIAFAIFFIFVILSQVTGFGLDNYSVKKVLPRLIVTVILVNLSFFICQIAVDISNIVGEQLNTTLSGINVGDTNGFVLNIGTFTANTLTSLLSVGSATIIGSYVIGTTSIELLVLPILLFALTALISTAFFYILLGARQAIIIILIVISPLAMICYALPNTKTLFDKWKKIFVALLIVYPICGALMGGGNLASRLLLISAGQDVPFMYALVVMLLSVIPFFFVPSLVRNSMTALGNLGTKITMAGRRFGTGSTRAIRGTDAYRDSQNRLMERNALRRANRLESGKGIRNRASRMLRGAGFTGASDKIDNSLEKARNRLIAKQRKLAMDDVNAGVHLDALTGEARDNAAATAQYKHETGLIDEAENSYVTNSDFNHNDIGVIGNEFDSVMRDLALDEDNVLLQARAKALSRMLMKKGSNGQDRLMQSLKGRTFDKKGAALPKDGAGRAVMSYLANDDKMNGQVKSNNYGDWKFMNHYAGNDALDSLSNYETMGAQSLTAQSIINGSDNFYKNLISQADAGTFSNDNFKKLGDLTKFADTATQALTNGNLYVKPEVAEWLNQIRLRDYQTRMAKFVSENSNSGISENDLRKQFVTENGQFQFINPALRVRH